MASDGIGDRASAGRSSASSRAAKMFPFAYRRRRERYRTATGAVGASLRSGSEANGASSVIPAAVSVEQFETGSCQYKQTTRDLG
jgi:hypothetical protein